MDKNNQIILSEVENKKRKDAENSSVTTETEKRGLSSPLTQPSGEALLREEIDLSHASDRPEVSDEFISGRTEEKQEPSQEDNRISIMNPNEVVFEEETQSEESDQEKTIKRDISDENRSYPFKSKAGKPVKDEVDRKRFKRKVTSKKASSKQLKSMPQTVVMSKGVAYLSGNTIRLAGGVKLSPGEEIKIKDKEFVLRGQTKRRTIIYVSAALLLILGLTLIPLLFKPTDSGKLIGIVFEEKTRMSLPQAKIILKETGKTVKSNQLGFFVFESLSPGLYTLETSSTGYKPKRENVTITRDQSTTVSVQLSPIAPGDLSSELPSKVAALEEGSQKPTSTDMSTTSSEYGSVRIKSNVSDPVILIDNRPAGTGNKAYRKIEPGKHVVTATKEGYYDWAGEVNIDPGKTINLEITLSEDKSYHSAAQTLSDYVALGNAQLNSNDLSSALTSFSQALTLKPDAPDALWGRGHTYFQMGEKTKALEELEKAAQLFLHASDYQKAMICYNDLLVLKDRDSGYFLNRGICYLHLNQYQKSIPDLKKALELDPGLFPGYLNLGEAYNKAGEYKLSIEIYKRARKLNPNNPQVFIGLTKAYFAKQDKSEAKKNYKKFEELSTYIDRENMKQDPEWMEVLKGIGVE